MQVCAPEYSYKGFHCFFSESRMQSLTLESKKKKKKKKKNPKNTHTHTKERLSEAQFY